MASSLSPIYEALVCQRVVRHLENARRETREALAHLGAGALPTLQAARDLAHGASDALDDALEEATYWRDSAQGEV